MTRGGRHVREQTQLLEPLAVVERRGARLRVGPVDGDPVGYRSDQPLEVLVERGRVLGRIFLSPRPWFWAIIWHSHRHSVRLPRVTSLTAVAWSLVQLPGVLHERT